MISLRFVAGDRGSVRPMPRAPLGALKTPRKPLPIIVLAASFLVAVLTCCLVARVTLLVPLGGDGAQDLEAARSIATVMKYEPVHVPRNVYDPIVSTNGPIQYAAAAAYALSKHNIDGAVVTGTVFAMVMLLTGLMLMRPWFSVIALGLLFLWPTYAYASTSFLGEIFTAGALLIGLSFLERQKEQLTFASAFRSASAWGAAIFFSVAVTTKLLALAAVVPLCFGAVFSQELSPGLKAVGRNVVRSALTTLVIVGFAAGLFLLQFAVTVAYSYRSIFAVALVPAILGKFVSNHTTQAGGAFLAGTATLTQTSALSSHLIFVLLLGAAAMLVIRRLGYIPLVGAAGALWFHYALSPAWERRLLPMFILIIVLGMREALRAARSIAVKRARPSALYEGAFFAAIVIAAACLDPIIGARALPKQDQLRQYAVQDGPLSEAQLNYHYSAGLVRALRSHRYVLTDGVWRFAEIGDFWDLQFYDRMALQNADLWNRDTVLLFDRTNLFWPITSERSNCASVLYVDPDRRLVLCRIRRDVPVDYQAPPAGPIGLRPHIQDLSHATWALTSGMGASTTGGGQRDYEYAGTGLSDGDEAATLTVAVHPGMVYAFVAHVDPTAIVERGDENGQFDLGIGTPDGKASYTTSWYPLGPPGWYSTDTWLCPEGVTEVQLGMQLANTTVLKGRRLVFSQPRLVYYLPRRR